MRTQPKKQRTNYGKGSRKCKRCETHRGLIRRADLMICRRCFREVGEKLGFKKTGSRGG